MARKNIFAPGERVRVQDRRWKHVQGSIYQDVNTDMFYRIIEGYIVTMHGNRDYALWAEAQYLNLQMDQNTAEGRYLEMQLKQIYQEIDKVFETYEAGRG